MRRMAWLILLAAAALFLSAPERAFAHPHQHHVQTTASSSAPAVAVERAMPENLQTGAFFEAVSASKVDSGECPHGQSQADCGFCCACAGSVAAALTAPETLSQQVPVKTERADLALVFVFRQPILDLSRPPKSFA